jgi:hypothetical protein
MNKNILIKPSTIISPLRVPNFPLEGAGGGITLPSNHLSFSLFLMLLLAFSSCKTDKQNPEKLSDDELMTLVQKQTFKYFWDFAEPNSGLARERYHPNGDYPTNDSHIVTSGGTGFGIMAILVGIERGFITREQGVEHLNKIVQFLKKADRFHGAWSHWINGNTGKVKPFSKKDDGGDLVETAFLVQGMLCARQYLRSGNEEEKQLAKSFDTLWKEVNWNWYTQGRDSLYWHWSPNYGWDMNFAMRGYNEVLITYILAASSPDHAIDPSVYHKCWARNGEIFATDSFYGYQRIVDHYPEDDSPVGPLFWAHYSYLGFNPKNMKDDYADYWDVNMNHSLIHHAYCVNNPKNYEGYSGDLWGMTSSYTLLDNDKIGYTSHRPDRDKGIISPTAALSSIPYTPKESLTAMRTFYEDYGDELWGPAGFYDAFSPHQDWVAERYLAIDQGPIIVMIENYRSGLLWDLFMSCEEVKNGLDKLGFKSN